MQKSILKQNNAIQLGWLVVLLLALPVLAFAQNKKTLEDKRKKLTKEIEITSKLLDKTKQNKSAVYDRFVTLQNQIDRREDLISTIENEVVELEDHIQRNTAVIEALNLDVAKMKAEYGQLVRNSFRRKMLNNPFMFLISADNFNQAFRRWMFLREYNRFRLGQAQAIAFTQSMLAKKVENIGLEKNEKEALLQEIQGQRGTLTTELTDKNSLLVTLSSDEVKLRNELLEKQKAKNALDNSIEKVISAEVRKQEELAANQRRAAAEKAAAKPTKEPQPVAKAPKKAPAETPKPEKPAIVSEPAAPKVNKTADPVPAAPDEKEVVVEEEDQVSQLFRKQRGRLPWPVDGGIIARSFGKQKHPTLKNIEVTNNGVDIRSSEDAPVKNIFEGKVAGVQYIPGHDYTVIVQHGNYYTVYSNLSETSLSKGDQVGAGMLIGRVSTNPISGAAELHFELWRGKERLNPAAWIK